MSVRVWIQVINIILWNKANINQVSEFGPNVMCLHLVVILSFSSVLVSDNIIMHGDSGLPILVLYLISSSSIILCHPTVLYWYCAVFDYM